MVALASPLRYPGGKAAMALLLREIRSLNGLGQQQVAEPFAGGAGAALSMLFSEDTYHVLINDLDSAVSDFWWALLNQPTRFLRLIEQTPLTIKEWRQQQDVLQRPERHSRLRRGFATFYLNRCNHSGIILKGGPIGGYEQKGRWKLDARFNREGLHDRCQRIIDYRDRISLSGEDGIAFVQKNRNDKTFLFIDPPYYTKGPKLYLNALDGAYHQRLARLLNEYKYSSWVLTYDDCPEVRRLYEDWAHVHPFGLRYSASGASQGREVCITPPWMALPEDFESSTINWSDAA